MSVLFSDVAVPGMRGIELGKRARTMYPDMRIVLASGYTATAIMDEMDDAKEFSVIPKPYMMAQILRQLR